MRTLILALCLVVASSVIPASHIVIYDAAILKLGSHAMAQQKKRPNLFQRLFSRNKKQPKKQVKRSSAPRAVVQAVKKSDNAKKILVMGDFIASGLSQGLSTAYKDDPNVVVIKQTSGSSTIVRPDYYDWNVKSLEWIETHKPDIVVFNIGANDRQDININGQNYDFDSEGWWAAYRNKVSVLARTIRASGTQLVWVGVPSFKFTKMTADILAFNGIHRDEVEKVGGVFVDIWDGFVDQDGKFIFTGSDINGQQVRLRATDGINLTSAGRRKLAFYAEKPLNRLLGSLVGNGGLYMSNFSILSDMSEFMPERAQDPRLVKKTRIYALTDPDLDGGDRLLGGQAVNVTFKEQSPLDRLIENGLYDAVPTDRADYFMTK